MKNILLVASECVPFIKTGGLADVVGELPKYMDKSKYDVRVMLPNYKCISADMKSKMKYRTHFYMDLGWRRQYVGVLEAEISGVRFYLIDNEYYFNGEKPYGNIYEDIEKFAFFNRAVLSALPLLDWRPDLIHCNDWQTGLLPVYLKDSFNAGEFYRNIKSIMTIHNLKFQGIWNKKTVMDVAGLSEYYFTNDKLEAYGDANYLKGGIVYADYVTTVSETYAQEIQTPYYGEGLDGLMRARNNCLSGIVNGIDYNEYNPEKDEHIKYHFNAENFRTQKKKNKLLLQEELGLEVNEKKFMVGIVSRLTDQKGFDLIDCVIEQICAENLQLVILGTGDPKYENLFRHYEWKYKDRVSASIYYNDERAHRIYASCDAFLMPSLFEPCGLSQLMSMRYGTIPIVRETGGLKDSIRDAGDGKGNGFTFCDYNADHLYDACARAVAAYQSDAWGELVIRAMQSDFSWDVSAESYIQMYQRTLASWQ